MDSYRQLRGNVRLIPTDLGGNANENEFFFSQPDFEEVLLDLSRQKRDWPPVFKLRQRYIRELARRTMPVPTRVVLDYRDAWVKSFTASRLKDPDPGDLPRSPDEPLEISSEDPWIVEGLVSKLLQSGKGRVLCVICQKTYAAQVISIEPWGGNGPPLADSGGVLFTCPEGHTLLQSVEWIS